jgi:hypothetical protein
LKHLSAQGDNGADTSAVGAINRPLQMTGGVT